MSAFLLAFLLQPAPPMPPTIIPPPIMSRSESRPAVPPALIAIRVTAGGQTLFNDQMRVQPMVGASFTQNRSEAVPDVCPGPERYDRQQTSNFGVRIGGRVVTNNEQAFSVMVNWTRPIEPATCQSVGSRTVSINQIVVLETGKTVVLTGDAGLRVELTLR